MLEEKTYKNYKELKEAMQWKTNSNQITEAQLEELNRVCDYVKDGRAYRIIKLKNKNMEDILLEREFKIHFGEYMKNNNLSYKEMKKIYRIPLNVEKGIYLIKNGNTIYIGSSINLMKRFRDHLYGKNKNNYTQQIIRGSRGYIKLLHDCTKIEDRELIYMIENEYYKFFKNNTNYIVTNKLPVRKDSDFSKDNISHYKTLKIRIDEKDIERLIDLMEENHINYTLK